MKRLVLRAQRTGRKIVLVCDGPSFHRTNKMMEYLPTVRDWLEVFWLPAYSPDLNLIERLWGHVKRTYVANVLLRSARELERVLRTVFCTLNYRRGHVLEVVFNVREVA